VEYDRAAIQQTVLDGLAAGKSLRSICKADGMPNEATVRSWMRDDDAFATHSARARELGHESIAEECIEIADDSSLKADERRVRIDTRLRLLGKWSQRYADKVLNMHSGVDGKPIELNVRFV
jgi:hypothetical protein